MYCKFCGAENPDDALRCTACGKPLQPRAAEAKPPYVPNYLVQAILVTLFCCIPFGIVAIVYAAQVNSKLAIGDLKGAQESSKNAKTWCWVSFGIGLAVIVLWIIFVVFTGVMSEYMNS
jgi:ABC-type Fe3+ transport system permease subunit